MDATFGEIGKVADVGRASVTHDGSSASLADCRPNGGDSGYQPVEEGAKMSDRIASGPLTSSLSRRGAVRGIAAAAAALPAAGVGRGRVSAQDAAGEALGLTGPDLSAIEFVGKIDQRGTDFTFYGFLTHLDGLDEADLFTNDLAIGR